MLSEKNRAWLVDVITTFLLASISGLIVLWAGGPNWAFVAVFLIVYFQHPPRRQMRLSRAD